MRAALTAALAVLLPVAAPLHAHRLDEYLQAATLSIEKDRVQVQLRLLPGVGAVPAVLAGVDSDRDGVMSAAEQRAYAERVLRDVSLTLDGAPLRLRLVSFAFPAIEMLKEGIGEIEVQFDADVPAGRAASRKLAFSNRHQGAIGTYLVNALVPVDPDVRITAQKRNHEQSLYELDYVQAAGSASSFAWWSDRWKWIAAVALLALAIVALMWRCFKPPRRR